MNKSSRRQRYSDVHITCAHGGLIALIQHNLWECNLYWLTGSLCCRNENLDFSQSLCPSKIYYLPFDYESSSVTMKKLYNCSRSKHFNWISSSTSPSCEDYGYSSELIARLITRLILLPVSTCNVYGDNRQNISDVETSYSFLISKNINSISILTCVHLAVGTNTSFAQDF